MNKTGITYKKLLLVGDRGAGKSCFIKKCKMIITSLSIQGQIVIFSYNHLAIETVRVIVNSSSQSPFGLNVIEYNEYQSINNNEQNLN